MPTREPVLEQKVPYLSRPCVPSGQKRCRQEGGVPPASLCLWVLLSQ